MARLSVKAPTGLSQANGWAHRRGMSTVSVGESSMALRDSQLGNSGKDVSTRPVSSLFNIACRKGSSNIYPSSCEGCGKNELCVKGAGEQEMSWHSNGAVGKGPGGCFAALRGDAKAST